MIFASRKRTNKGKAIQAAFPERRGPLVWFARRSAMHRRLFWMSLWLLLPGLLQIVHPTTGPEYCILAVQTACLLSLALPLAAAISRNPVMKAVLSAQHTYRPELPPSYVAGRAQPAWDQADYAWPFIEGPRPLFEGDPFGDTSIQSANAGPATIFDCEDDLSVDHSCGGCDSAVNPATGLAMVGGMGGVDSHGNVYGCDLFERHGYDAGFGISNGSWGHDSGICTSFEQNSPSFDTWG